jgi:hypothetical protein
MTLNAENELEILELKNKIDRLNRDIVDKDRIIEVQSIKIDKHEDITERANEIIKDVTYDYECGIVNDIVFRLSEIYGEDYGWLNKLNNVINEKVRS